MIRPGPPASACRRVRPGLAGLLLALALISAGAVTAESRPAAHEEWSGHYACDANERDPARWPGYRAAIRMTVRDGHATVVRETMRVRETMGGQVRADGSLELTGTGEWRDGPAWRWSFEGRFIGDRFEADGAMLSAQARARLRECSMTLLRVTVVSARPGAGDASAEPAKREGAPSPASADPTSASARASPDAPAPSRAPAAPSHAEPGSSERPAPVPLATAKPGARSNAGVSDAPRTGAAAEASAVVVEAQAAAPTRLEGSVAHGAPDLYHLPGRRGLAVTLEFAPEGGAVRFELYAPGALVRREEGALVVQGLRISSGRDTGVYRSSLAADGPHLLVVGAAGERSSYALDVTLTDPEPGAASTPDRPAADPARAKAGSSATGKRGSETLRDGAIALFLILAAAATAALLQRRRALPEPLRYAALVVIAACGLALLFMFGRPPPQLAQTDAERAGADQALPARDASAPDIAEGAGATATLLGGTFVCGEARTGETSLVSTIKYYPDGLYLELARTWSDRVLTLTAVRLGTFEWAGDGALILRQASASPNIEYGEPFVKTDVVETRSVTGDLARGYTARWTSRVVAGKPQRVPEGAEQCARDDAAGPGMDRLREALRPHLPKLARAPAAAAEAHRR
jgi:hypothetical protein